MNDQTKFYTKALEGAKSRKAELETLMSKLSKNTICRYYENELAKNARMIEKYEAHLNK